MLDGVGGAIRSPIMPHERPTSLHGMDQLERGGENTVNDIDQATELRIVEALLRMQEQINKIVNVLVTLHAEVDRLKNKDDPQ